MLYGTSSQIYTIAPTTPYFTYSSLSLLYVAHFMLRSLSTLAFPLTLTYCLPQNALIHPPPLTLLSPLPTLHRADRSFRISLALMQNRHFSLFKCTLLAANASIFCAAKQIRNAMWLLAIFFFSQILPFWGLPVMLGQSAPNKYGELLPKFSGSRRRRQTLLFLS